MTRLTPKGTRTMPAAYYLLTCNVQCQLIDPNQSTSYENYPSGSVVTILTLQHALDLVASGNFSWYGPAPEE